MRRVFLLSAARLALGAGLLGSLALPAAAEVMRDIPPNEAEGPPPPPPGPRYVWQPGHWHWNGMAYVWIRGHYLIRQAAWHEFVPGHWAPRAGGFVWVPAHWR